jgi:hypothetical protein
MNVSSSSGTSSPLHHHVDTLLNKHSVSCLYACVRACVCVCVCVLVLSNHSSNFGLVVNSFYESNQLNLCGVQEGSEKCFAI